MVGAESNYDFSSKAPYDDNSIMCKNGDNKYPFKSLNTEISCEADVSFYNNEWSIHAPYGILGEGGIKVTSQEEVDAWVATIREACALKVAQRDKMLEAFFKHKFCKKVSFD